MIIAISDPVAEQMLDRDDAAIQCEVVSDFRALEGLRDEWDSFVESVGSDIYFSFEWCRTWWEHYGDGRQLVVLMYRLEGRLIGVLPFVVFRLWVGPVPIQMARFVGADSTIVVLNPPVEPSRAADIYMDALGRLVNRHGCDCVHFGPLSGEYPHADRIIQSCAASGGDAYVSRKLECGVHSVIQLPGTFDAYLASLDKSQRGNYRRDLRNLSNAHTVTRRTLTSPDQIREQFPLFAQLHGEQWQRMGKLGHFGDWPRGFEFNRDIALALAPSGLTRLHQCSVDGETVGYDFSLRFGKAVHWRLPARHPDPKWERFGLGRLSLVNQIELAIAEGVSRIEAGPGHYEYKLRYGGREWPVQSVMIAPNRHGPLLKAGALRAWAYALNLAYYRIWFSRVAPKLPLRRRPLWKSWTRSRT